MSDVHKMPKQLAQYADPGTDFYDPEGEYRCNTCMMRVLDSPFKNVNSERSDCTAVKTHDGIHLKRGGCNYYVYGDEAKPEQINPNRLSISESGYVENGPFGCSRCRYFIKDEKGCYRVGSPKEKDPTIYAKGCCGVWVTDESGEEDYPIAVSVEESKRRKV